MSLKSLASIALWGTTLVGSSLATAAAPTTEVATLVSIVTKEPDILHSHVSMRLSSFVFFGQLSMSSPKSVNVGTASNDTPPDVAPMMLVVMSSPVAGSNSDMRIPALSWSFLKVSVGICVNLAI